MKILRYSLLVCLIVLVGCESTAASKSIMTVKGDMAEARLIVKSASLTLSVVHIDETILAVSGAVAQYGGYVQSDDRYTEKRANLHLKIPSEKLEPFVNGLSSFGKVKSKSTASKDVTDQVIDIDARLTNLLALRVRYRELLSKANTVKEIISIEKELANIQTEIDAIDGRKKSLLNQVSLSSVHVTLKEKTIYGPIGYVGKGIFWAIGKLFVIK